MFGETCSVQKSSFRYKNLCARVLEIFSELLHSNDLNLHTIRTLQTACRLEIFNELFVCKRSKLKEIEIKNLCACEIL